MRKALTSRALAALLLLLPNTSAAQDLWDAELGVLDIEEAGWSWSFEEEVEDIFLSYGTGRRPTERAWASAPSDGAMHGERVASLGDEVHQTILRLDDETFAPFDGRRVEIRFWYRPEGTSVTADITWFVGDSSGQVIRGEPSFFVHRMGQLSFQPTGRRRDDGWRELSSGPFDFSMGHALPPALLTFRDANSGDGISSQVARDPRARVLIDAITIQDLGAALIPDTSCTATTEADVCGSHGLCSFGRCVDAASYLGSAARGRGVVWLPGLILSTASGQREEEDGQRHERADWEEGRRGSRRHHRSRRLEKRGRIERLAHDPLAKGPCLIRACLAEMIIMCDQEQGARIVEQGVLQALDRWKIEVIGRLVEDESPDVASQAFCQQELSRFTRTQDILLAPEDAIGRCPERGQDVKPAPLLLGGRGVQTLEHRRDLLGRDRLRQIEDAFSRDVQVSHHLL